MKRNRPTEDPISDAEDVLRFVQLSFVVVIFLVVIIVVQLIRILS